MIFPPRMSWWAGSNLCRRFGGRLHIDDSASSVEKTYAMVEAGELLRSQRCSRVWLGASDSLEEAVGGTLRLGRCLTYPGFGFQASPMV